MQFIGVLAFCLMGFSPMSRMTAAEKDYYRLLSVATSKAPTESRSKNWKPSPEGLPLEISGMTFLDDQRLAVAIRKGEIWILDGVYDEPAVNVTYKRFANALHEPLGLLQHDGALYTAQRSELTKIRDVDGDDIADEYLTAAKGWAVTGHYHEYAFGPKLDAKGNLWLTLNIGMGLKRDQLKRAVPDPPLGYRQGRWRGWGMVVTPQGKLVPMCAGMRSPAGLGANAAGDMFYTDQQGNWVATNSLHHFKAGSVLSSCRGIGIDERTWLDDPGSEEGARRCPNCRKPLMQFPQLRPPAVWFPYKRAGTVADRHHAGCTSAGKFGPFSQVSFLWVNSLRQVSIVSFLKRLVVNTKGHVFHFGVALHPLSYGWHKAQTVACLQD